jgi:hypothetical protein
MSFSSPHVIGNKARGATDHYFQVFPLALENLPIDLDVSDPLR